MNIAVFGASGNIGQAIVQEALQRGHTVTAIARDATKLPTRPGQTAVQGDARDSKSVAATVAGHDAIVSSIGPSANDKITHVVDVAHALIDGAKAAGVSRVVVVGGAGSLEIAPGVQLYDTPDFPEAWRAGAKAQGAALDIFRTADLDWTYVSPAALIGPGERTGSYRKGGDQLLTDAEGQSRISYADYAIAILDEIEKPTAIRRRITVAY